METAVISFRGITVGVSFFEHVTSKLGSAEQALATATAPKVIASLTSVISRGEETMSVLSEALLAATATDSLVVASATAAIGTYMDHNDKSLYGYTPNLAGNMIMLIIMGLATFIQLGYAFKYRQPWYGSCICIGFGLEFGGLIARVVSHFEPISNQDAYMCQIICLTIAPCFIMAGLYCILAKLVIVYGEPYSVLAPLRYTQIFVVSDVFSLVLQGAGGGAAAVASKRWTSAQTGTNIMVAGLAVQVASMTVFIAFWAIFLWRVHRAYQTANPAFDPRFEHLRDSGKIKWFAVYVTIAILCVYVRSIYRVVELAEGWGSYLMDNEPYFLVLDAAMMSICAIVVCLPGAYPGIVVGREVSVKKKAKTSADEMSVISRGSSLFA